MLGCLLKGLPDQKVASICKKENLVLVTNDSDFTDPELYTRDDLFSLVWLHISQSESHKIIVSFKKLLSEYKKDYEGRIFILTQDSWDVYNLGITVELHN